MQPSKNRGPGGQKLFQYILYFLLAGLSVEIVLLVKQNRQLQSQMIQGGARPPRTLEPGDKVPPLVVNTLDSQLKIFDSQRDSLSYLLYIFTVTCPACRANLANWKEIVSRLQHASTRPVSICEGKDVSAVREYVGSNSIAFEVFLPVDTNFARDYKASVVPQTLLLRRGTVERVWLGAYKGGTIEEILTVANQ